MIPSVFALIVLAIGLILVHFGVQDLTKQLNTITITPSPYSTATGAATR